jgi:hypothetical protein
MDEQRYRKVLTQNGKPFAANQYDKPFDLQSRGDGI